MKRIFSFLACALLVCALAVPCLAAELQGGYYLVGDSALGSGLRFYLPADYALECLTYDENGNLFNMTNSSVYLYCSDYPSYTIYAPRFSTFQYRNGSGYDYAALSLHNVTETNVQIMLDNPLATFTVESFLTVVVVLLIVIAGIIIIWRR